MDTAWVGLAGSLMGIAGVVFSLVTASRNNAKWNGIVEQKMDAVINSLNKLEQRLQKLEDKDADVRVEIGAIKTEMDALKRSLERLHTRVDNLTGGRDG